MIIEPIHAFLAINNSYCNNKHWGEVIIEIHLLKKKKKLSTASLLILCLGKIKKKNLFEMYVLFLTKILYLLAFTFAAVLCMELFRIKWFDHGKVIKTVSQSCKQC